MVVNVPDHPTWIVFCEQMTWARSDWIIFRNDPHGTLSRDPAAANGSTFIRTIIERTRLCGGLDQLVYVHPI